MTIRTDSIRMDTQLVGNPGPATPDAQNRGSLPVTGR